LYQRLEASGGPLKSGFNRLEKYNIKINSKNELDNILKSNLKLNLLISSYSYENSEVDQKLKLLIKTNLLSYLK